MASLFMQPTMISAAASIAIGLNVHVYQILVRSQPPGIL